MNIDATDEAIIAELSKDGRQSNREVARQLDVSEGLVRQRLNKLINMSAVRFDVVTDPRKMGVALVAIMRISVAPKHLEGLLSEAEALPEIGYLSVMTGVFNVQAIVVSTATGHSIEDINARFKSMPGVNDIQVRQVVRTVSQDVYEIVCPKTQN